jgi:hypothetical protein
MGTRGPHVSIMISHSRPNLVPGSVNETASWPALNSSRNRSSVMRSPRGSGSLIASPLRKTASDLAPGARQSLSVTSLPAGVSQTMSPGP